MAARERTKYPGVYRRVSKKRKINSKKDICFDITYKLEGKKIWEKVGWLSEGYSEKLAADIRAERVRSIRHGLELPKQKAKVPFFKDAWDKYKRWAEANKRARDDVSRYNNHIAKRFADKRMNQISAFDLERMKSELLKEGLAPATVKHVLVIIRQVFNKAIAWGLYKGENPVKAVRMPVVQNQRQRFLSHEEAALLLKTLAAMRTPDLHDMALLSLHTGLRAGEIFGLKGYDLDFKNDLIRITDPKNKITRHAYMTTAVKEMLRRRRPNIPEGFVFPDRNGKRITNISKRFGEIIKRLGFNEGVSDRRQQVTFHSLRHTFASWLALQGESLITIRDMLGHKTTAMTERYSHLIPDHKRKAVTKLELSFDYGIEEKEKKNEVNKKF
ncbi:MAG: site-specific integrase [Deltaproteobacteria bacterium]|nr:site-specific integrase [Deltaproteobacteria bacterium]